MEFKISFAGIRMAPTFQTASAARAPRHWVRLALAGAAFVCSTLATAQVATEADMSMLSDFGVEDITNVMSTEGSADLAGIYQSGGSNRASITQINGNNIAHVWQVGENNYASVAQDGDLNAVRLWQEGEGQSATLTQIGSENRIAAVQYESASVLSGIQDGTGNVAAIVMMGGSHLTFLQQGDKNSIVLTLPANIAMGITQIGSGLSANVSSK
jgi:minor curlin subunit